MKEVILRSFIIPFVNLEDVQNVIKFEAKKYLPIDIQGLDFVFYTIPFTENQTKHLRVIFFAVRKEVLARYERIFKQANAEVSYCEPSIVSLTKALLFKKESKLTNHLAFLILDKDSGSICFIDQGIPQFIREFSIGPSYQPQEINGSIRPEESNDSTETLNLRIVNEVENSFGFYARQFSGKRVDQVLVSSGLDRKDLLNTMETELKVRLTRFSSVITTASGQSNDMDAIYAMGACVDPPMKSFSEFNFLGGKAPSSSMENGLIAVLKSYKDVILTLLICSVFLAGVYIFFQLQLKTTRQQYDQLSAQAGVFLNEPVESIQAELRQNTDQLTQFKNIRTKSDVVFILLRVASHLPQGFSLSDLRINYNPNDFNDGHVTIDMNGTVYKEDPDEQIVAVDRIFSDFKNDKELSRFIRSVSLGPLNREDHNGRQVMGFNIHCS